MSSDHTISTSSGFSAVRASMFWLTLTTLSFWILVEGARVSPWWLVTVFIVILAYPIWFAQREGFLFNRRLLLNGATIENSRSRRIFWRGRIGTAFLVITAFVVATLLLAFGLRLDSKHWALLFADALILPLLYAWYRHQAVGEVRPELIGIFVRRWPLLWTNLLLLTVVFALMSFFTGEQDLRQAAVHSVYERAFQEGSQGVAFSWMGGLVGVLAGLDQVSWALAQQYIPGLPSAEWRLLAWAVFLAQLGLLPAALTTLYLGVLGMVEHRRVRAESLTGEGVFAKTFIVTILILAVLSIYPALKLRDLDPDVFKKPTDALLTSIDPCREYTTSAASTQVELSKEVSAQQKAALQKAQQCVDQEVDRLFQPVEAGVDRNLDWYFTVIGEYERLAALAVGDFPKLLTGQISTHLFESSGYEAGLEKTLVSLDNQVNTDMAGFAQTLRQRIGEKIGANLCAIAGIDPAALADVDLGRDLARAGLAAGSGTAVAGSVILSQKVMASVVGKVAAKKSFQVAAATGAKFAA